VRITEENPKKSGKKWPFNVPLSAGPSAFKNYKTAGRNFVKCSIRSV